jgi:hypothetical protein
VPYYILAALHLVVWVISHRSSSLESFHRACTHACGCRKFGSGFGAHLTALGTQSRRRPRGSPRHAGWRRRGRSRCRRRRCRSKRASIPWELRTRPPVVVRYFAECVEKVWIEPQGAGLEIAPEHLGRYRAAEDDVRPGLCQCGRKCDRIRAGAQPLRRTRDQWHVTARSEPAVCERLLDDKLLAAQLKHRLKTSDRTARQMGTSSSS